MGYARFSFFVIDFQIDFPVSSQPGKTARLTVILNSTTIRSVPADPRIIPWDATHSQNTFTAAVVHSQEELSYRNVRRDITVLPGQTLSLSILKRGVDNTAPGTPIFGSCANSLADSDELFGDALYTQASCRSSVIQMIAERSVNCSLISLPKIEKSLPYCGPLEGLALMYILREQGSLVTFNPEMLNKFEAGIARKCPVACYYQYFQPVPATISPDDQTAEASSRLFNVPETEDISIVELRYRADEFIRVRRYQSGIFQLFHRLGSICGCGLMLLVGVFMLRKLFASRKGLLFKRRKSRRFTTA